MSVLKVRPYASSDDEGFRHVRAMVYRDGMPVPAEDELLRPDCIGYVAEANGTIVAATTVLNMTATKHGKQIRCGGVAAVGVLPEKRRSGIGGKMMAEILPLMRNEGFALSSLYPFRGGFYRRVGYEYCGARLAITCPQGRLPKVEPGFEPYLIDYRDRDRLRTCYEAFAGRYAGMNIRNEQQWWRVLGGDSPLTIYAVGDPLEAYIVARINSEFWANLSIKEFCWSTDRGYRSMLAFFHALAINKTAVDWREPNPSPFYARYMDQGVTVAIENNLMFRILDVPVALQHISSDITGDFTMSVIDDHIPENRGPWQICCDPTGTRVEPSKEADFQIPIGTLTQAFLGYPDFRFLVESTSLGSQACLKWDVACQFFGSDRVYCMDYF